ncbi:uncharacterized protein LOC107646896 [Arachis ipaensis]|uniref:uncharacterized protein LOC107646896 n=1 Tax=Arachis ipaensis TaxID=130454 RepID=UPI0007AF1125|nr:uncharacterized protein LOC107646896 [Arachis ipaensis]
MAGMANLANTMEANAAATLQAVQILAQPARSGNENREGAEDSLRGVPRTLTAFRKADPLVFNGSTNHTKANNWFQAMGRALLTQLVPYDQFMEHAAYQLVGEAQQWWQGERRLLLQQNVNITWVLFEEAFYNKFSRISQGTPESYEGWKCIKYEVGLREDIRRVMARLEIRRFSELVDKARIIEEHAKLVASSKDTPGENTSRERTITLDEGDKTSRDIVKKSGQELTTLL